MQSFSYDAEHRLIEVRTRQAGRERRLRMRYDPLGRRVEKSEYDDNGHLLGQTRFAWDGLRLLQEQRHGQVSLYVYEGESHEPLARVDGQGPTQHVLHFHNDLSVLPELLTNEQGHVVWQARYLGWGSTLVEAREPGCLQEQNLRFQGQSWTGRRGCITTRSGFMIRTWDGSRSQIRSGCRAGISCMGMRRIRRVGLIRSGGEP